MSRCCALSTKDNPYNPFEDFKKWLSYDIDMGYCSSDYVGRIARTSSSMTDDEYNEEIERAIDEIIKYNPLDIYIKVTQ